MDVSTIPQESDESAQQSAQGELVSGTSGVGYKRMPPTTSQQDQSAKRKPQKPNNENEGDIWTIPQESDESDELSIDINELIFEVKTHTCEQFPSLKITEESIETACATSTLETAQPQSTQSNIENKCHVEWKLATPDTWNVSEIKNTLQNVSCLLKQWFEIEFDYIG